MNDCVFCRIVTGQADGEILQIWDDAVMIIPLRPVAADHRLVLPRTHVADAATDPVMTAITARRAAQAVRPGEHMAVNVGPGAGQSVAHLHIHLWPCRGTDRCMPWGCPVGPDDLLLPT